MNYDYKKMTVSLFGVDSKQRILFIKNNFESKPLLTTLLASLTKDVKINYDHLTTMLDELIELPELNAKASNFKPYEFNLAIQNFFIQCQTLFSEHTTNKLMKELVGAVLVRFSQNTTPSKSGNKTHELSARGIGDIADALFRLQDDKTYSFWGVGYKQRFVSNFKNEFKQNKTSFTTLEPFLSKTLQTIPQSSKILDQKRIEHLNGLSFLDFNIIVPSNTRSLTECGLKMKICVGNGGYEERIADKKTNVFFLKKDNEFHYCVELNPEGELKQFKGLNNENSGSRLSAKMIEFLENNRPKTLISKFKNVFKGKKA